VSVNSEQTVVRLVAGNPKLREVEGDAPSTIKEK